MRINPGMVFVLRIVHDSQHLLVSSFHIISSSLKMVQLTPDTPDN